MSKRHQILYFACYALAAAAIGHAMSRFFPDVPRVVFWLAGAVIFLAGALAHEIAIRRHNTARDLRRMALLHRANTQARDELERLRWEVAEMRETIDAVAQAEPDRRATAPTAPAEAVAPMSHGTATGHAAGGPPDDDEADALAAEVSVLHALVQQLYPPNEEVPARTGAVVAMPMTAGGTRSETASEDTARRQMLDVVRDALRQNRIDLRFQSIVTLPQRKPCFLECVVHLRTREDEEIPPETYLSAARESGLAVAVDNMLLFRTVQHVRAAQQHHHATLFFCAVTPSSVVDQEFLQGFVAYLEGCAGLLPNLVLVVAARDIATFDQVAERGLDALADAGFQLCLSGVEDLDIDVEQVAARRFTFVTIDARTLMPAARSEFEAGRVRSLKQALDQAGIDLIVDHIEREQMLVELLDFDIDFGAGALFGEPSPSGQFDAPLPSGRAGYL